LVLNSYCAARTQLDRLSNRLSKILAEVGIPGPTNSDEIRDEEAVLETREPI
jgi:hypothetical protein